MKYLKYFEAIIFSPTLEGVLHYLSHTKKNKVAWFLANVMLTDFYKDNETINFINLSKNDNMISYLATNRRGGNYEENFTSTRRAEVRIGRAVRKIYDTVKQHLNYEGKISVRILKGDNDLKNQKDISGKFCYAMDVPIKYPFKMLTFPAGDPEDYPSPISKIVISGHEFTITGKINETLEYWDEFQTIYVESEDAVEFPILTNKDQYTYDKRMSNPKFDTPVLVNVNTDFQIRDSDIEKFVNEYISYVKMSKADETSKIQEVRGDDITKWYNAENYQSHMGKLGGSCMSHKECSEYFDIYTNHPDVISLLIITNKENKLVGRALLWKLDGAQSVGNNVFMDRVYTANDSDDNMFINYAIKRGYIYRTTSAGDFKYYQGTTEIEKPPLIVQLSSDAFDYEYYPYLDTLIYLNETSENIDDVYKNVVIISNVRQRDGNQRTLQDTEGHYSEYRDDDYDDDDY